MWPQSLPCSTASFIMGTCSSAARGVGERKPRPLRGEGLNESRWHDCRLVQHQIGRRRSLIGDAVPKPLVFTAFPPEWLFFFSGRFVAAAPCCRGVPPYGRSV